MKWYVQAAIVIFVVCFFKYGLANAVVNGLLWWGILAAVDALTRGGRKRTTKSEMGPATSERPPSVE